MRLKALMVAIDTAVAAISARPTTSPSPSRAFTAPGTLSAGFSIRACMTAPFDDVGRAIDFDVDTFEFKLAITAAPRQLPTLG
jgi:hypothetical protein